MKHFIIILSGVLFSLTLYAGQPDYSDFLSDVKAVEKLLSVEIVYDRTIDDTWNISTYRIPSDMYQLKHYLDLLKQECTKYPVGYIAKSGITKLVLCEDFKYYGVPRAAMPDNYGGRLYLSIDGAYNVKTDAYLIHVLHHELNHATEYAIWGSYNYIWNEWTALAKPGTSYGSGGASAYADKSGKDYYAFDNPAPGFINYYSMTAQEEDRSEIFALMMSDIERPALIRLCKTDGIICKKVQKMITSKNNFAGVSGGNSYWEMKNKDCCASY